MNTTNNTESTVPTPPLPKTPVFQALSIDGRGGATIAFLAAVVIVLCAMVFCSPEDLWNAGWHVGYYGSILLWLALAVFTFSLFSAACPIIVGYSVKELVGRVPSLLALSAPKQRELAPGLSIAPDDLIRFDSPDESPEQFAAKIKTALHTKNRHYLFIFPRYKSDCVIVRTPDPVTGEVTEEAVTRFTLPWVKTDDWQTPASDLENEPWEGYEIALRNAVAGYRTWAPADKMKQAQPGSKALALAEALTRTTQVLMFVLLSAFTLNAQPKSVQVAQYVGLENYAKKRLNFDTNIVRFHFAKFTIERPAKRRTFAEILPDAHGYEDGDMMGPLQKITISWQLFPRVKLAAEMPDTRTATRAEIAKFLRPAQRDTAGQPIPTATGFEGMNMSLPDSATLVQKIEGWKSEARKGKFMFVTFAYWDYISWWMHRNAFPFFAILIIAFGIIAWASCTEYVVTTFGRTIVGGYFRSIHAGSSFVLFLSLCGIAVVVAVDVMIWLILQGWGWLPLTAAAIVGARMGGKFIGNQTPNTRVVGRNKALAKQNDQ